MQQLTADPFVNLSILRVRVTAAFMSQGTRHKMKFINTSTMKVLRIV